VLIRHVLRNSLIPIISLWGLDLAQVIGGGAILTETVYNLHGVGTSPPVDLAPRHGHAAVDRDADRVLRRVLGALVDILYAFLDPRIRL
jgi:peptide/nickel transport system permease protein